MNTEESYDGYMSIVGDDARWENRLTSRVFIKLMFYNPILKAKKVKAPVLVMAGSQDSLVPLAAVQQCAARLRKGELIVMDCNHFAPYTGETFLTFIDKQEEFLVKHLF